MNSYGKAPWPRVRIGDILTYLDQRINLDDAREYITITVKRRHGGLEERERLLGHEIKSKKQFCLIPGAFIISRIQCWHEAYAIVSRGISPNMIASANYDQFAISSNIDPRFFWWLSHSPQFRETIRSSAFGVVIEKMVFNRDAWLDKTVPMPPIEEQQRIVTRIEELTAKIAEARALRRQATETSQKVIGQVTATMVDYADWPLCALGELLSEPPRNGLSPKPEVESNGRRMLRINAVSSSPTRFVDLTAAKLVNVSAEEARPFELRHDDVFIVRYNGDLNRVAKPAIFKGANEEHVVFPDKLMRLRLDPSKMLPDFLVVVLNSRTVRDQIEKMGKTTAGNIGISGTNARAFMVAVPPLSEQRRIVAYLEELQAKVDVLKALQVDSSAELDALVPSILDKAFRGDLVDADEQKAKATEA